jgi:hypothetical protein
MTHPFRLLRAALAGALLAAAVAPALSAQVIGGRTGTPAFQPRMGVGYVANVPNQFVGASGHFVSSFMGGMGLYVDAKFDLDSPEDDEKFIDSLTAADVENTLGDQLLRRDGVWTSVNVAVTRAVTPQLVAYAGVGYSDAQEYVEYLDEQREMGMLGFYTVHDEEASGGQVNFLGGVMFQISRTVALQLGGETAPGGFTVGVSYLVPLR